MEQLKQDKCNLENNIISLNHLRDKQMNDIQNIENKINNQNQISDELNNKIRNKIEPTNQIKY